MIKSKYITYGDIDFVIYIDLGSKQHCSSYIYNKGIWEGGVTKFIVDNIEEGTVFIDAGAAVGWFSLIAASRGAKVFAYELNPDRCELIHRAKEENGFDNITIVNRALMAGAQRIRMSGGKKDKVLSGGDMMSISLDESLAEYDQYKVDLMKIDVEGAELSVLNGAMETIQNNSQLKMVIEMHSGFIKRYQGTVPELFKLTADLGFNKYNLANRHWVFEKN